MNDATRSAIAEAFEKLATQESWNSVVWQQCYDFVMAHWENELLKYIHDDLIHYDGVLHSGFRVNPYPHQLDGFRQDFRSIAAALRADLSIAEAKKQFGL